MSTHKILSTAISKSLPKPLAYLQTHIADNIQALVQYSPTIGLMGKTGAGKSSLINALFQSNVSTVNHVERGTTQAIPLQMALRKRTLTFVDFSGIGESCERDKTYRTLYQQWLPKLDLVIWVLRADERAWTADEFTYQFLVRDCGYDPKRFLFILNQADKIEPCREWDSQQRNGDTTYLVSDGNNEEGQPFSTLDVYKGSVETGKHLVEIKLDPKTVVNNIGYQLADEGIPESDSL